MFRLAAFAYVVTLLASLAVWAALILLVVWILRATHVIPS